MESERQERVVVGKITGVFGVKGWLKVYSHTEPPENIFNYSPWMITLGGALRPIKVLEHRVHGKGMVVHLDQYDDRDLSQKLVGAEISITREQLPPAAPGEYYWADLIGLNVVTQSGVTLGRVEQLLETGANDVLVVSGDRERLIPFVIDEFVKQIDLEQGVIRVDWDPEF
ncbi:MAG: ribosome maturation factor RimM [Gammaproteobacteria bacterium]|nr:ribosome maturation factor RimM [Gammaproteobacteria bacterium]